MLGTFASKAVRLLLTLAAATLLTPALTAYAGDGSFVEGRYNFTVSVRFNATEVQLRQIEVAFQNASRVLYDATDGQQQFGTITIVNNDGPKFTEDGCFTAPSEASLNAEYWIEPQGGRAYATFGHYGIHGEHITLYFTTDFQQLNGADGDAYTIAHEHAHHAYGVADEYADPTGQSAECAAEPDSPALNFCLMDNFFSRGGKCTTCLGVYTLNEFCVAGNHDPDGDTAQQALHHESCWETISHHPRRAAAIPQGLPVEEPPPAGLVTFQRMGGSLRIMLVIDRSSSMADLGRMTYAKGAAKTFVDLLRVGDSVGLVSYSSSATLDAPLARIASPDMNDSARVSVKSAVDALIPNGGTFIADGLRTAVSHFVAQPQRSANEVVILISDGNNNTGDAPSSAIPALQQSPGVPVMALLVGESATLSGQMTLQNLATQTGGKFFLVNEPQNLERLMLITQAESSHAGLVARQDQTLLPGEVREFPAFIEAGARGAVFGVSILNGARNVTLSLRTPSGRIITAADALPGSNLRYTEEPFGKAFQVCAPEAGMWTIIVGNGGSAGAEVQAYAFSEQDGVELVVSAPQSLPTFPEVVELHASPTYRGERVVGALVTGAAVRPDSSRIALTFYDDGLAEHADAVAGDGIYSARFGRYNTNGTYTFDVQVANFLGTTYAGESLFAFAPSNAKPVPQFTRISSTTVVVSGVPAGIQEADLALTGSASPDPVVTGSNVVYTFNVTNKGPQTAAAVKLMVDLAPQTTLVSCAATGGGICGGSPANPTVTFASLAPGTSQTVWLTAKVDCAVGDGTQLSATAVVSSQAMDFEPGNNSATLTVRALNPPPVISGATADPSVLWAPNHKMVSVRVSYKITDNCGPVATRLSVVSNEPINGTGDGDTAPDWEVVDNHLLLLRAERAGNGSGRVYTITITATDSAGGSSTRNVIVIVPKSQNK
jgi:uncharacterized repeat protein (TIGR01451 family)